MLSQSPKHQKNLTKVHLEQAWARHSAEAFSLARRGAGGPGVAEAGVAGLGRSPLASLSPYRDGLRVSNTDSYSSEHGQA
jgi:hypothetical protein